MSAEAIRDYYAENEEATIAEAADALDLQPNEVHRIMDTHWVQEDGTIEEVGPGQGGGWVKPAEIDLLATSTHIGNRWPDGTLQEEPFDLDNEQHRAMVGLSDEDYERMKNQT